MITQKRAIIRRSGRTNDRIWRFDMGNLQQQLMTIREGQVKPVYLVHGSEHYLIERVKRSIIDIVLPDANTQEFNFGVFNMHDTPVEVAVQEARSVPFFGDKRLIIITHPFFLTGHKPSQAVDHNLDDLIDYLKAPADFSVMVIIAPYDMLDKRKKITKEIQRSAEVLDVSPMKSEALARYVQQTVRSEGYRFQDGALTLLMERTDYQLTTIMNELEKLYLYHINDPVITNDTIKQLVPQSLESNIFDINDLVLNGNSGEAIEVFKALCLQKEEPLKILVIMLGQFRLLVQVHILKTKGYQQSEIAKLIGAHPYRIKLASATAQRFSKKRLTSAYRQLVEADYQIKSGKIDPVLQFEMFVLTFSSDVHRASH